MSRRAVIVGVVAVLGAPIPAAARELVDVLRQAASELPAERAEAAQRLAKWRPGHRGEDLRADRMLLTLLLRDRSPAVRAAAAAALGEGEHGGWTPTLARVAEEDSDPRVRAAAHAAWLRQEPLTKSPATAAGLSLLLPGSGAGHMYLGRYGQGAAYLATSIGATAAGVVVLNRTQGRTATAAGMPLVILGQNIWFYSVYAAYRDARLMQRDIGYAHPMTDEGLAELSTAPFRPSVLARPWFWAGLPVMVAGGVGLSALLSEGGFTGRRTLFGGAGPVRAFGARRDPAEAFALGEAWFAGLFLPVAVGEEALFRGVLQTGLSEELGDGPGLALSSVIFGATHLTNFAPDGPSEDGGLKIGEVLAVVSWITLSGAYMGYASQRTDRRLETSVALHFWYNFMLSTVGFLADPDRQPFAFSVTLPLP